MPLPSELVFIVGCYLRVDILLRAAHVTDHLALKKVIEACSVKIVCYETCSNKKFICATLIDEHRPSWKELHSTIALTKDNRVQRFDKKHFAPPNTPGLCSVVHHWDKPSFRMLYLNNEQELRLINYFSIREKYDLLIRREVQWARYINQDDDQSLSLEYSDNEKGCILIRTTSGSLLRSTSMGKKWKEKCYKDDTVTGNDIVYFDQGYRKRILVLCKENLYVYNSWSSCGRKQPKPHDTGVVAVVPYGKYLFYIRRNGQIVRWDNRGTITYERDFLVIPYLNSYLIVHMFFYYDSQERLHISAYHPSELVKHLKCRNHISLEFINDYSDSSSDWN